MAWWQYLLLVNVYLVLFYGFYRLLLSKETFFRLNRVYLVSSAVLSFVIPIIQTDWVHNLFITQKINQTIYSLDAVTIYTQPQQADTVFSLGQVLAYVYLTGMVLLVIKLIIQLLKLKQAFNNPATGNAFSFFGKVKINEDISHGDIIGSHEDVHARQWHSADVLLIELVTIINWFNPVVYLYRKAIKHIHEFIADNEIVTHGTTRQDYAMLLLSQTLNAPVNQLANTFFNHSLLKQRIMMLHKNPSQRKALLKYGLSAPLFALMLILSSATAKTKTAITAINKKAAQVMQIQTIIKHDDGKTITATTTLKRLPASTNQPAEAQPAAAAPEKKVVLVMMTDTVDKGPIFTTVEQTATFPGGLGEFYKFLGNNMRYPAEARNNNVQGRVICRFVVEKDGSISDVRVMRGLGSGTDEEAVRVLSMMPKWEAGRQNGHVVRQEYTVPISFALQGVAPKTVPDGQHKDPPPPPGKPKVTDIKILGTVNNKEAQQGRLSETVVMGYALKDTVKAYDGDHIRITSMENVDYYVDGVKVANIKNIDPKDIATLDVHKNGANGRGRIDIILKKNK